MCPKLTTLALKCGEFVKPVSVSTHYTHYSTVSVSTIVLQFGYDSTATGGSCVCARSPRPIKFGLCVDGARPNVHHQIRTRSVQMLLDGLIRCFGWFRCLVVI